MTITVTEEQFARIHAHLFSKYPWLYRKNTAYTAELVAKYRLTVNGHFINDIKEVL